MPAARGRTATAKGLRRDPILWNAGLEAVSAYGMRAGEKLRRHGLEATHMAVFMHTSRFNQKDKPHSAQTTVHFPEASNDTFDLIRAAQSGARKIFRDGHRYAKAGIIMNDLVPARSQPRPLFDARDRDQSDRLMMALDAVNGKFGRGSLVPASAGIKRDWQTKFDRRSPRYTTNIKELPIATAR
jgi:DNA polymerase V